MKTRNTIRYCRNCRPSLRVVQTSDVRGGHLITETQSTLFPRSSQGIFQEHVIDTNEIVALEDRQSEDVPLSYLRALPRFTCFQRDSKIQAREPLTKDTIISSEMIRSCVVFATACHRSNEHQRLTARVITIT